MKTFKEFFNQETKQIKVTQDQLYLDIANKMAEQHNMPKPTNLLAKGGFAIVFNTTNPNVVARVSDDNLLENACDYVIAKPEIQSTGGVNKILGKFNHIVQQGSQTHQHKEFLVMFKEKLNVDWKPHFRHIFIDLKPLDPRKPVDRTDRFEMFDLLPMYQMINYYIDNNEKMPFEFLFTKRILMELEYVFPLSMVINFISSLEIKEIKNLVEAIKKGLPTRDLHAKNLALDKNNNLVAIDC